MTKVEKLLSKFNPEVPREWLLALAGVMWSAVGIMLFRYAVIWLSNPLTTITEILGLLGVVISIWANQVQFSKLALKNIDRILSLNKKAGIFTFQSGKGYLIIIVMIATGIILRHSFIPKPYLAVVYAAIGGALLQASLNYYLRLYRVVGNHSYRLFK